MKLPDMTRSGDAGPVNKKHITTMINHLIPANNIVSAKTLSGQDMVTLSQALSFVDNLVYGRVLLGQKLGNLISGHAEVIQAQYSESGELLNPVYECQPLTVHELLYGLLLHVGRKSAVPGHFLNPRYAVTGHFVMAQKDNALIEAPAVYMIWGLLRLAAREYGPAWQAELRQTLQIDPQFDAVICSLLAEKASCWVYRVENDAEVVLTLDAFATILRAVVTAVRPELSRRIQLTGLSARAFQNPVDFTLTEKLLSRLTGLGVVTGKLIDTYIRWQTVNIKSGGICVNQHSQPALYQIVRNVCAVLCMPVPEVYIYDDIGGINAYTTGVDKPIIVLTRMAVSMLDEHELAYIIGHECGHILCNHVKYHTLARMLAFNLIPGGELLQAVTLAPLMNAWYRRSELSADRAGLLACQNMEAVKRAMLKMMGTPFSEYQRMRTSALVSQAIDFQNLMEEEALDRTFNMLQTMSLSHPRTVFRCVELLNWIKSGEYHMLINATAAEREQLAEYNTMADREREQADIIAHKLADWAERTSMRSYRELLRGARTLLLGASEVDMAPYTTIFSVQTHIRQSSEDLEVYVTSLCIRYVDTEGPREYVADIISQEWSDLPSAAQSHFIRNGADMNYETELYRFHSR